ncbi:secretin N-terminal domain-containing protein [Rhodocyclus tenuis]|uniref:NolW-like domain-containing protein n=1 Tax=Rhodocyclus tenuis TaxID=1066 RepID=A0A840G208_RHOTE|nr:secretin N-terminal domain-containing protein [Rhodocyclus tenuis]MBB4248437.1 hypothetical protein [Rhodocyclus tenuis]
MRRLLLLLCFLAAPALAQELEVIPLKHRSVEQLLPALRPLLEPGGALSGMGNQLIVRASQRNRQQLKQALAALDTPQRRLMIRVSQNRDGESALQAGSVYGEFAGSGSRNVRIVGPSAGVAGGTRIEVQRGGSRIGGSVVDTRDASEARASQSVQVVEGGNAFIQVGRALPLPLRQTWVGPGGAVSSESVVYRDVGQGFYARPQLNGERVTLEISPQADSVGAGGAIEVQRLTTTVSGRLGEWIELGGSGQLASQSGGNGWTVGSSEARDSRSVWLRVDEVQ